MKLRYLRFIGRVLKMLVAQLKSCPDTIVLTFGLVAVLIFPASSFGQGCATCYTTAAAAKDVAVRALRHGILILAAPPVVLFGVIVGLALRRREHATVGKQN